MLCQERIVLVGPPEGWRPRAHVPFAKPAPLALAFLLASLLPFAHATGEETSGPPETPRHPVSGTAAVIDQWIEDQLDRAGVEPAEPADDSAFLRRLTLDLAGRIPTTAELDSFLHDENPDKRAAVIERLIASPDFAYHLRNELDLLLLARLRKDNTWREYLLEATRDNRGWDQIFREVILPDRVHRATTAPVAPNETDAPADLAEGDDAEVVALEGESSNARQDEQLVSTDIPTSPLHEGAVAFLRHRAREVDDLTNDTCILFFGVNVSCAKCHDHPLVADWEQDHFFGMSAFFHRTYLTKKNKLAERFTGMPRFTTLYGEDKTAQFMFLSGDKVEEPPLELSDEEKKTLDEMVRKQQREDEPGPLQLPDFSPRENLVRMALQQESRSLLARAAVNRVWARLLGRGFVEPLDQMHSENPPSHPELLDWLAEDFREHGYDLTHLIRGIVSSQTYARSSRWGDEELPDPELFAVALPRPLTPYQLGLSLHLATLNPEPVVADLREPTAWTQRREQLESQGERIAGQFEIPHENFQVSVDEALLFSNSERFVRDYLPAGKDRLVGYLSQLDSPEQQVQAATLVVLSRRPESEEREVMARYLAERSDRATEALQQLVWALLATPEFRFNY